MGYGLGGALSRAAQARRFWRSTIAFDKRSAKSFIRIPIQPLGYRLRGKPADGRADLVDDCARQVPCRSPLREASELPRRCSGWNDIGCRAEGSVGNCVLFRPSSDPRRCCGIRASPHRRLCRPGMPRLRPGNANGSVWRRSRRRWTDRRALCGGRRTAWLAGLKVSRRPLPTGSGSFRIAIMLFTSFKNEKSRRGGTPEGIPPRRLTRQRAPRHSRVALYLVIRQLRWPSHDPLGCDSSSTNDCTPLRDKCNRTVYPPPRVVSSWSTAALADTDRI